MALAEEALAGVGDAARGEWRERGDIAVHLRRRLSAAEEARIGPAVDIRGTEEQERRVQAMRPFLPPEFAGVAAAALP